MNGPRATFYPVRCLARVGLPRQAMWFGRHRKPTDINASHGHGHGRSRRDVASVESLEPRTLLSIATGVRYPDYTILSSSASPVATTVDGLSPSQIRKAY